jgi:hypothetical protein
LIEVFCFKIFFQSFLEMMIGVGVSAGPPIGSALYSVSTTIADMYLTRMSMAIETFATRTSAVLENVIF